jgi:hypothetical protein
MKQKSATYFEARTVSASDPFGAYDLLIKNDEYVSCEGPENVTGNTYQKCLEEAVAALLHNHEVPDDMDPAKHEEFMDSMKSLVIAKVTVTYRKPKAFKSKDYGFFCKHCNGFVTYGTMTCPSCSADACPPGTEGESEG